MLRVCRFNPIQGGGGGRGWVYLPPLRTNFSHKIRTAINFYRNFLTFNFYGQLKHDIRSLSYVSRCLIEGR